MNSKPGIEEEGWDLPLDPSIEASLQPEVHTQSLFFRVARKREEYFSDVEAISQTYDIEDVPTPCVGDLLYAICNAPTQPDMMLVEKQPVWPAPLASRLTLILPATIPPSTLALLAARFRFIRLLALLRKCWLMLRSLQNTRKLPAVSPGW